MNISALILTKNEEEMVEGCLKQLEFADEIILLDQGSTDNTVTLAKKYTTKIYSSGESGFDKNRNTLAKLAKGKWLLYLDADERIDDMFVKELKESLKKEEFSAFYVPRKNYVLGKRVKHGGWWPDYVPRVFKREDFLNWTGEVHETAHTRGSFGYFKSPILHKSARSINLMMEKSIKWTKIEAMLNYKNGAKPVTVLTVLKSLFREFIIKYFLKAGFMDRTVGLTEAIYQSLNQAIILTYLWELQNDSKKIS